MPETLIERGIGETRIAVVDQKEIIEARVHLDDVVPAGSILEAKLAQGGKPALARAGTHEYLMPAGAPGITQGATLFIEVTREAFQGSEPWKRPLARLTRGPASPATIVSGTELIFPTESDLFEQAGWSDLLDEARTGAIAFNGGELRVSPTPAMTLIDIDGQLPGPELALAGAHAAARSIGRHGIGGSIGLDFPTLSGKAQRQTVDDALEAALPRPFERTAMNGFGFVQIIRPRRHASLFELALDRAVFEARALLRRAAFEAAGPKRLVAHPAVTAVLKSRLGWTDMLSRQVGGAITLRPDPAIAIHGGYAEKP